MNTNKDAGYFRFPVRRLSDRSRELFVFIRAHSWLNKHYRGSVFNFANL